MGNPNDYTIEDPTKGYKEEEGENTDPNAEGSGDESKKDGTADPSTEGTESTEGSESSNTDGESEESTETNSEASTDSKDDQTKDQVPLAKHLDTKNQLKEAKRKLAELEDSKKSDEVKNKTAEIKKKWIDKGYSEEAAQDMADVIGDVLETVQSKDTSNKDMLIKSEIEDLKADPFYKDIGVYSDKIKDKMAIASKLGSNLSVEEAYLLVVGVKNKLKESKIDSEVKESLKNKTKGSSTGSNVANSGGSANNAIQLSPEDRKALAGLQKMQPDAKWTTKKYYEMMVKKD